MIDIKLLRAEMARNGCSQKELAEKIGMRPATIARRMKKAVFLTDEVEKIIDVLNIQNPMEVFFAQKTT